MLMSWWLTRLISRRKDDAESSDRELARLIAEMFKGTGIDENMVVAFSDANQAKKAARQWEFSAVPGTIQILDAKGKKAKSARGSGGEHERLARRPAPVASVPRDVHPRPAPALTSQRRQPQEGSERKRAPMMRRRPPCPLLPCLKALRSSSSWRRLRSSSR
jgi:hypothetical protein